MNYVSRNFYQQVLFFVLPIYYASATHRIGQHAVRRAARVSALVSTLDVVYDRHLSTNRDLVGGVLRRQPLRLSHRGGANRLARGPVARACGSAPALSFVGFASFYLGRRVGGDPEPWVGMLAVVVLLALVITYGQRLIPPVPMRLSSAAFGDQVERQTLQMNATIRPRARRLVGHARRRHRDQRADGTHRVGPTPLADRRRDRAHHERAPGERRTQGGLPSLDGAAARVARPLARASRWTSRPTRDS